MLDKLYQVYCSGPTGRITHDGLLAFFPSRPLPRISALGGCRPILGTAFGPEEVLMRSVRTWVVAALCVLALPWATAQAGGIVIGVGLPGPYYRPYYRPYYYGP